MGGFVFQRTGMATPAGAKTSLRASVEFGSSSMTYQIRDFEMTNINFALLTIRYAESDRLSFLFRSRSAPSDLTARSLALSKVHPLIITVNLPNPCPMPVRFYSCRRGII
jgi:hypothetical protein